MAERVDFCFAGAPKGLGTEGVSALPSVVHLSHCRNHACLTALPAPATAWLGACAGAVTPLSAVVTKTRRETRESPALWQSMLT
jgi:hypothetical protein